MARLDHPILTDDKARRDRQRPTLVSLISLDIGARCSDHLLHLATDPKYKIQSQGISIVQVGQYRKWCAGLGFHCRGEPLSVRRNGDDLTALGSRLLLRLRQRKAVESAIRAPMATVEDNGNRSSCKQLFQLDE